MEKKVRSQIGGSPYGATYDTPMRKKADKELESVQEEP